MCVCVCVCASGCLCMCMCVCVFTSIYVLLRTRLHVRDIWMYSKVTNSSIYMRAAI